MTNNQRSQLLTGSITLNVFLVGLIITHIIMGWSYATHDDLDEALANAPYPWLADRPLVMSHLANPTLHENDQQKRNRIKGELQAALEPLKVEIRFMSSTLNDLRKQLEK